MPKNVQTSPPSAQAKVIGGEATDGRQLSPRLESEVHDALARALRLHKAETIAAECGVDRATIYKWAAKPRRVPLVVLDVIAAFDPDPEMLSRIAGHLLAAVAARALIREAQGRSVSIFHEIAPGRWAR